MNAGEYQAGIAPYGYKKDTEVKNHLIIEQSVNKLYSDVFVKSKKAYTNIY